MIENCGKATYYQVKVKISSNQIKPLVKYLLCSKKTIKQIALPHKCKALKEKQIFDWFQTIRISLFQTNSLNVNYSFQQYQILSQIQKNKALYDKTVYITIIKPSCHGC